MADKPRRSEGRVESRKSRRGLGAAAAAGVAAGAAFGIGTMAAESSHHGAGATYTPLTPLAGVDVYLSPAHHWPFGTMDHVEADKPGCFGYIEEKNNIRAAKRAASNVDHGAGGLRQRGYYVKVGNSWPDINVAVAVTIQYDFYIAMHSNGSTNDGTQCAGTAYRFEGHYSNKANPGNSEAIAEEFRDNFDDNNVSTPPGYSPEQSANANQKTPAPWWEINNVNNPIADRVYLETNYHDNPTGWGYLKIYQNWAWRIGWSVDTYLGYPVAGS